MAPADDRCPECGSTNLKVVNVRDIRPPTRDGDHPAVARKVEVQCRRCKWSGFVVKPVAPPPSP